MTNLSLFPIERNRYFYGKLLTVRDFELEQKYLNDKRRLLNLAIAGPGVVCGLTVSKSDDMTLMLESGLHGPRDRGGRASDQKTSDARRL